ncbi:ABC transporter ATP-binding protein uup [bacterium BMS3Abin09]|nr:ABC transporter ATP-binding protein uup [bacterium BMS3Abin09]GBE41410.1 ABC transporter ATP-binding protein uup [bacterium BMS3Bbin09]
MALLSLKDIKVAFGGPELIDRVSLQIERGERVCLVGRNGAGKSTLMKIISGEITPDTGEVMRGQGLRIASLDQEVSQDLSGTVFEIVAAGVGDMVGLLQEYHSVSHRLSDGDAGAIADLERIQHQIESSGGWQIQQRVETVLSRLSLDPDAQVDDLSGGYKRRVLLAKALVNEPDLLLLDEPTNHLDITSIGWLEELLLDYSGSILFITHDRKFLRSLSTRIIELDRGKLTDWPCDYATYLLRRQAELDAEAMHNALFDKKLSREEAWIRQGIKARRTRNEGRVTVLKEMRNERRARRTQTGSARMVLNEADRSGKLVLKVEGIGCIYEGRRLFHDFSTTILRGDKIGIIGPNGSGKTTLLKMLLGTMEPHSGSVRMGTRINAAYFDQHREQLSDDMSVMDNVANGSSHVTVNGKTRHVIGYLEDFLFPPERARSPVKVLSGGERNRLLLAMLFTKPSNVLVMDEPTNDLDTDTLDLLEEMLMQYDGTVLLVSHDREFLNNIVTSTIVFESDGRLEEYMGGYDDWLRQRRQKSPVQKTNAAKKGKPRPKQERPRILTFKEKKELGALPALLETLEAERDGIFEILARPEFYQDEGGRVAETKERLAELEQEIAESYERWEFLEAIFNSEI